jgi:hypothetical protein
MVSQCRHHSSVCPGAEGTQAHQRGGGRPLRVTAALLDDLRSADAQLRENRKSSPSLRAPTYSGILQAIASARASRSAIK